MDHIQATQRNLHGKTRTIYLPDVSQELAKKFRHLKATLTVETGAGLVALTVAWGRYELTEVVADEPQKPREAVSRLVRKAWALEHA